MHPELEKLIEMALADGQVNDKEREIVLRKAEKLGLDVDEVEMYLEGIISSTNVNSKSSNLDNDNELIKQNNDSQDNNQLKSQICDSYIDKDDLKKIVENISSFENKIIEIEQYYSDNFNDWINNEFLETIKNHPKKIKLDELKFLMNASSFLSGKKYKEGRISDFLNRVINNEDFIGYFALGSSLIPINTITSNNSFSDNYMRLLFTKKSVYFFDKNIYDISNNRFICSGVEYKSIKSPEIYNLDIFNCSTNNVIYKLVFDSADCNHNFVMENNGINFTDNCFQLDFLGKSNINSFRFLHLFSLDNLNKISFDEIIINLKTKINFDQFKSVLKKHNLTEIQTINLQKINNYIENFLFNFNSFIEKKQECIYYYSRLVQTNNYSFTQDEYFKSLGHSVCTPEFNEDLEMVINYYKYSMTHIIVILDLRDKLLNFYLTNNFVDANEIMLKIDNYGVFLTKFERTSIEKLEEINKSLNRLNNTLIEGFSMISDSIQSLNNSLESIKNSIDKVESTMDVGNFIQIIQTYQMYKINKNTKSYRN